VCLLCKPMPESTVAYRTVRCCGGAMVGRVKVQCEGRHLTSRGLNRCQDGRRRCDRVGDVEECRGHVEVQAEVQMAQLMRFEFSNAVEAVATRSARLANKLASSLASRSRCASLVQMNCSCSIQVRLLLQMPAPASTYPTYAPAPGANHSPNFL